MHRDWRQSTVEILSINVRKELNILYSNMCIILSKEATETEYNSAVNIIKRQIQLIDAMCLIMVKEEPKRS